jgi:membrane protein required for colicin V production
MTAFDYTVLIIMISSMLVGTWRGVLGEIIAIATWILSFFAAKWCGDEFARQFLTVISDQTLRIIVAWVLIFVIVMLSMGLVRQAIRGLIRALRLTPTDRTMGVLFGAVRGSLIVLALVALGGMLSLSGEKWWREASLSSPLETIVLACRPWLPPEIAQRIRFNRSK